MNKQFEDLEDHVQDLIESFKKGGNQLEVMNELDSLGIANHAEPGDTIPNTSEVARLFDVDKEYVMYAGTYEGDQDGDSTFPGDNIYFIIK